MNKADLQIVHSLNLVKDNLLKMDKLRKMDNLNLVKDNLLKMDNLNLVKDNLLKMDKLLKVDKVNFNQILQEIEIHLNVEAEVIVKGVIATMEVAEVIVKVGIVMGMEEETIVEAEIVTEEEAIVETETVTEEEIIVEVETVTEEETIVEVETATMTVEVEAEFTVAALNNKFETFVNNFDVFLVQEVATTPPSSITRNVSSLHVTSLTIGVGKLVSAFLIHAILVNHVTMTVFGMKCVATVEKLC